MNLLVVRLESCTMLERNIMLYGALLGTSSLGLTVIQALSAMVASVVMTFQEIQVTPLVYYLNMRNSKVLVHNIIHQALGIG